MTVEILNTKPNIYSRTLGGRFEKSIGRSGITKIARMMEDRLGPERTDTEDAPCIRFEPAPVSIIGFQYIVKPKATEEKISMRDIHTNYIVTFGISGYKKKKPQKLLYNHSMIVMNIGDDDNVRVIKVKLTAAATFQYHGRMTDPELKSVLVMLITLLENVLDIEPVLQDAKFDIVLANFSIYAQKTTVNEDDGDGSVTVTKPNIVILRRKLDSFLRTRNFMSHFVPERFHGIIVKYTCIHNVSKVNYNHCTVKIYRSGKCVCSASSYERIMETVEAIMSHIAEPNAHKLFLCMQ